MLNTNSFARLKLSVSLSFTSPPLLTLRVVQKKIALGVVKQLAYKNLGGKWHIRSESD